MMHKAWSSIEGVPHCFPRSFVKFQGHVWQKNHTFWPKLGVSGLYLQFELTEGYKMMHRVWTTIEEVFYFFQCHPSNFKVTRDKKSPLLNQIERFRTATPVWIHPWLWNDARSLTQYKRGALLFFNVIYQILWLHRTNNLQFRPEESVSRLLLQFEFTDWFEIIRNAWSSIDEVPYCFSRSSIKFQCHTGWKIDDLNAIWVWSLEDIAAIISLRFALFASILA